VTRTGQHDMSNPVSVRFSMREFDAALRKYVMLSKTAIPDIVNRKAFFIARGACRITPKADLKEIKTALGRMVTHKDKTRTLYLKIARKVDAPLAAVIINKRRGEKGLPGLYGAMMTDAIESMLAARSRSIAFLKSGWLPAIRTLQGFVKSRFGAPTLDRSAKQIGTPKGKGIPARNGWNVKAVIENAAAATHGKNKEALIKYGEPALAQAFRDETASTMREVEIRLRAAARESGIRTN
jgi:hypothetical protein